MRIGRTCAVWILPLVSVLAAGAFAAGSVTVKVTGSASDPVRGYYVEYTLNGTTYRSDEVGSKINATAWANMSEADRKTTIQALGYFQNRTDQFGSEVAIQMGNWYSKEWIAASEILKNRLLERDYPGLAERFENSQSYFAANFMPTTCTEEELKEFAETKRLFDAEKDIFSWACAAYEAMRQAEYKRTQVAVQSVAGDLISLICDKVLVPNITPSGALSGAASIGQKIFAEVLEYADKASGYCDNAVAMLVGQRVTASIATEVMTAMANTIDCQYNIIRRSLEACHDLQNQIDAIYPGLKEQAKTSQDAWNARNSEAFRQYFDSPITGEPDAGIGADLAARKQVVDTAWAEYSSCTASQESDEKQRLQKKYEDALVSMRAASQSCYDNLQGRYQAFASKYLNAKKDLEDSRPSEPWQTGNNLVTKLLDGEASPFGVSEADFAEMKACLQRFHADYRTWNSTQTAWEQSVLALKTEAKQAYLELSTDWDAIEPYLGYVNRVPDDLGSGWGMGIAGSRVNQDPVLKAMEDLGFYRYRNVNIDDMITEDNAKMDAFEAWWREYNDTVLPKMSERYGAGVKQYTDAVDDYDAAWEDVEQTLEALPSYVKEQEFCLSGLVVKESSELARKFLVPDATGTLDEALAVRETLRNAGGVYRGAKMRLKMAAARIKAHGMAFGSMTLYGRWQNYYGSDASATTNRFARYADFSRNHQEHALTDVQSRHARALTELERDFNNYTYAHCTMVEQLGDLNANRELYSTNILEETEDPYVRKAYAARRLSLAPKSGYYATPWSMVMPGYYVGYGKTPYQIAMAEAEDRNRGTCSYSYFIPGYAEAVGGIASDPYDNFIKPLLDEIDGARKSGGRYEPIAPDPVEPEPIAPGPVDPDPVDPAPVVAVVEEADIVDGIEVKKAATVGGVLLNGDGTIVGSVEVKLGKAGKNGSKVSGSLQLLDGKKVTLKGANYDLASGSQMVTLSGKGAELTIRLGGDASGAIVFAGTQGAYTVSSAAMGGEMVNPSGLAAYVDPSFSLGVEGEILSFDGVGFVPFNGEPVGLNGTKWVLGKAALIKFAKAKGSKDKTKVLQGYDDPKKPNISGLRLTYTPKTGMFKGTFNVYALQGALGKEKLKKYIVSVSGIVVEGRGFGKATCKKPKAGPFDLEVR